MIQLTKDNTATPDAYSAGDGSDPISVAMTLDGSGIPATVTASPATSLFVWANNNTGNIGSYTGITVEITGADAGVTWELSLNGSTGWASSIALPDMNVSSSHQAAQIYARATAVNNGTVQTNNYLSAKVKVTATENPA